MDDFRAWAYLVGTPAWLGFLVYLVRTIRDWPNFMARWNERQRDKEAAKDGDWKRLRDEIERRDAQMDAQDARHAAEIARLDARCERLETAEQGCRAELAENKAELAAAKARIGELEGFMMGQGKARNDAAAIVASDRLARREEEEDAKKGGGK